MGQIVQIFFVLFSQFLFVGNYFQIEYFLKYFLPVTKPESPVDLIMSLLEISCGKIIWDEERCTLKEVIKVLILYWENTGSELKE